MSPELTAALERVRGYKMSAAEVREQRVSFVYGMLPFSDRGTKDEIRKALAEMHGWADESPTQQIP